MLLFDYWKNFFELSIIFKEESECQMELKMAALLPPRRMSVLCLKIKKASVETDAFSFTVRDQSESTQKFQC